MGALTRMREELEALAGTLDDVSRVPDAAQQPEITKARAVVEEARAALSSAFLSRRAMVLAREAIARAEEAVGHARDLSRVLRARSAALRTDAEDARSTSKEARAASGVLSARSRQLDEQMARAGPGVVTLDSGIPPDHPEKAEIEAALMRTLGAAGGQWRVWITVPAAATWWGLRVRGPAIEWVGTLQDPEDQTAQGLAARLEPLARVALAESLYRGHRPAPRLRRPGRDGES